MRTVCTKLNLCQIGFIGSFVLLVSLQSLSSFADLSGELAKPDEGRVTYGTDIEGKGDKWQNFMKQNTHLFEVDADGNVVREEHKGKMIPKLKDGGGNFVFGGDAFDQGNANMQIADDLIGLKDKHSKRVVLLAGNRDINKMRVAAELDHPAWTNPNVPPPASWGLAGGMPTGANASSGPERLKWLFANTMGAANAFENHRQEMLKQHIAAGGSSEKTISDQEVYDHYKKFMHPSGVLGTYLSRA